MTTIRLSLFITAMLIACVASGTAARSAMAPEPVVTPLLPVPARPADSVQPAPAPEPVLHGVQANDAHNIIYLEMITMAMNGSLTINYERVINPYLAFRVGYGVAGAAFSEHSGESFSGGVASAMLMTGGNHKLELDCGMSLLVGGDFRGPVFGESRGTGGHSSFTVEPALGIGYRYQPSDGGFFFRIGAGWTLFYGVPVQLSAGFVF
ncbi:MAG TPA: hypothetical protein VHI13_21875 [Candidatus Kapabacteria bacterium]|nr:hypothetical protein [Candidatus Kapabacteria bacterium]